MLMILRRDAPVLETIKVESGWRLPDDAVWIELVQPTSEEERAVEAAVGVNLPTREEMSEIEASSRLYQDNGATFMTATLLCGLDETRPVPGPVTFVLTGDRLVTIRYVQPRSFAAFAAQAERQPEVRRSGLDVFLGLLETIVDRTADLLEHVSAEVEATSQAIFKQAPGTRFKPILNRLAQSQSLNANARESLVSLARLVSYAMLAKQVEQRHDAHDQLRSVQRDIQSLTEHASYVSGNVTFLLDAALGLINIEQNEITKVFSIYAVVLLPPTMIATIYGMNFHDMPELNWRFGYPLAWLAMALSALVPFWWFKRKGWL